MRNKKEQEVGNGQLQMITSEYFSRTALRSIVRRPIWESYPWKMISSSSSSGAGLWGTPESRPAASTSFYSWCVSASVSPGRMTARSSSRSINVASVISCAHWFVCDTCDPPSREPDTGEPGSGGWDVTETTPSLTTAGERWLLTGVSRPAEAAWAAAAVVWWKDPSSPSTGTETPGAGPSLHLAAGRSDNRCFLFDSRLVVCAASMPATMLGGNWTNSTSLLKSKSTPSGGDVPVTAAWTRGVSRSASGLFETLVVPLAVLAVAWAWIFCPPPARLVEVSVSPLLMGWGLR